MNFTEYAAVDAINWSSLKHMRDSPLHYRHNLEAERADTASMALGRAVHTAVFEPDQFMREYAIFKGPRRAGKEWEAFAAAHPKDTILKLDEYSRALAIRDAVRAHPEAAKLLSSGKAEQFVHWADHESGLVCKGRIDFVGDEEFSIIDLKSAADISERQFMKQAARLGYMCQIASYREGYEKMRTLRNDRAPKRACIIIAVESKAPHDVGVFELDEDDLYVGLEEWRELMAKVAECRRTNTWPGRYPGRAKPRLPAWAFGNDENADDLGLTGWKESA